MTQATDDRSLSMVAPHDRLGLVAETEMAQAGRLARRDNQTPPYRPLSRIALRFHSYSHYVSIVEEGPHFRYLVTYPSPTSVLYHIGFAKTEANAERTRDLTRSGGYTHRAGHWWS